jgi:hypothetical protein
MFTRLSILSTAFVCAVGIYTPAQADSKPTYDQESKEERFNVIKGVVIGSTKLISNYGADKAYDLIKTSLGKFRDLHQQVKEAEYVDDVIDEVTDALDEIATTYEDVANLKRNIAHNRAKNTAHFLGAKDGTNKTVQELEIEKKMVVLEAASMRKKLSYTTDEIEKQKLEISIKGNESIINSLEAQETIWRKFHAVQEKLLTRLNLNGRKIDLLLHVLKTNAAVYREAANVAKLRRSAKAALKNLQSLSDIQGILGDLQNSWVEVNDLVSEISSADFNIELQ